ncbi:L-lysine exporter family protein LysE/ArgO [Vibrio xiamenensis]|uniref:L-lysine exporter family protein LysE/ArgO n=1 Tax=Vibrio xiamenensis TaxID=861298 RepID=A0A1G8C8H4_9VIBR|nr:LysE/ArgO family amino acid transporter [Vibrio xiamenensis]SDH41714.1 L-lysine exporter family protein LysE/ArgO [Vibrio xiamenensis]
MNFWVLLQGFGLGATMIIPIGAQNAYVLNQGIKRHHHFTTATTCSLLDMLFISLGMFGGGALLSQSQTLLYGVTIAGMVFLTVYGALSLKSALKTAQPNEEETPTAMSLGRKGVILGAIGVTVFNPHLYLDTVVILGSLGGQFSGLERVAFALGTMLASIVWFYSLSYAASKMSHILSQPKVRRIIDGLIAVMMFTIAFMLSKQL